MHGEEFGGRVGAPGGRGETCCIRAGSWMLSFGKGRFARCMKLVREVHDGMLDWCGWLMLVRSDWCKSAVRVG